MASTAYSSSPWQRWHFRSVSALIVLAGAFFLPQFYLAERIIWHRGQSRSRLLGRSSDLVGEPGRAMTERRGAEARQSCCPMTDHLQGSPPLPDYALLQKVFEVD